MGVSNAIRKKELFDAVERAIDARDQWEKGDEEHLTRPVEEAIDDLVGLCAVGSIPATCRKLLETVTAMATEWEEWKVRASYTEEDQSPGNGFWRALAAVNNSKKEVKTRKVFTLEPVAEFTRQKVSPRQICLNYEWVDEYGRPQFEKVREELASPGTHVGPDFVPPLERAARALEDEEAREDAQMQAGLLEMVNKKDEPVALSNMIAEKLSCTQISKICRCSTDRVYELCDEQGLDRPPMHYDVRSQRGPFEKQLTAGEEAAIDAEQANPTRGQLGPLDPIPEWNTQDQAPNDTLSEEPEVSVETVGSPLTLEQQIVELHLQDKDCREIAAIISNVSWQKAAAVIRRYKKQPDVFEVTGTTG